MARCRVDESIKRVVVNGFQFPLGVHPIEPMTPRAGYRVEFEPSDGGEVEGRETGEGGSEGLEEWPDRYMFDVVVSAERLEALCRSLFGLLPGRIYPILDFLGQDSFREVDPYISYELLGMDRFMDAVRRFRGFFFEDGWCGFGAMIDDPFLYVFVDEHKIVTIRAETGQRERVERVLAAFDLEHLEDGADGPAGADSAEHEHQGVLLTPDDRPDLLSQDEIVERLRDDWRLTLNIDPLTNVDDEGRDLGVTRWRCVVRCYPGPEGRENDPRYAEVLLAAGSLRRAEELAQDAADELRPPELEEWEESVIVASDRLDAERWAQLTNQPAPGEGAEGIPLEEGITSRAWIE
jgi:hypothetical protein